MRALVSVQNIRECSIALEYGISLIDLKAPKHGSLGNLDLNTTKDICHFAQGRAELSATIGDIPLSQPDLIARVLDTHECGVNFVKIGMFNPCACWQLEQFKNLASKVNLIAVMFAEDVYPNDFELKLKQVGFVGAMLDTRVKDGRNLADYYCIERLSAFVERIKLLDMMVGLAGSLSIDMYPLLVSTGPDYLGFRSALCDNGRDSELSAAKLMNLNQMVKRYDLVNSSSPNFASFSEAQAT